MTKNFTLTWVGLLCFFIATATTETTATGWTATLANDKVFIENKGQFDVRYAPSDRKVLFAIQQSSKLIYFTDKGITYHLYNVMPNPNKLDEWQEEMEEKREEYLEQFEEGSTKPRGRHREESRYLISSDFVTTTWLSANPNVQVIATDAAPDYHNYGMRTADGKTSFSLNKVKGYKKLLYKNLYPGIDVEYTFLDNEPGFKYSVIVHPGANPAQVKMGYGKNEKLSVDADGSLHIATDFGDIVEHAPLTFYENNHNSVIGSKFSLNKNTVAFNLKGYDKNQTIVIDPWIQSPTFNTQWDCVWECDKDAAGNVYVIGGVMPMQLIKYNAAGAVQWTYNTPYDTTSWLGTFAVDNAGNSYVTCGSIAAIQKVSTAGAMIWDNPSPGGIFASTEFWSISFNCDQTRLVIGGTGNTLPPQPYIYQVDMSNGNVTNSLNVTGGALFPTQEVRSIVASGNGRYYWMSHDSLGSIKQNFGACPNPSQAITKSNHGYALGYKCENFRVNNTGIAALRTYGAFAFTHKGNLLHKRNFANGTIVGTANIPGGGFGTSQVQNSGIDIDDCGNIYVGSKNQVVKYDQNLTQLATYPTTSSFNVYDVHVTTGGNIIACGSTGTSSSGARSGYIQHINGSACAPVAIICCDANICQPPTFCVTAANYTLTPSTPGGVWSGPGITNPATGVFSPSAAGVGNHTIIYTLPCGADSVTIVVNACTALSVCMQPNGDLTVSGGSPTFTWSYWQAASSTPITNQAQCQACGGTWFFGQCLSGVIPITTCNSPAQWVPFGTGVTVTPPAGKDTIRVVDNAGTTYTINGLANVQPCVTCPTITVAISNQTNVTCPSTNNGSATVSPSGGTGPYTYTWNPNVSSTATANNLTAGTYTVTAKDANNCTGTVSITITAPNTPNIGPVATVAETCQGQNNGSITSATATGGSGGYTWTYAPASNPSSTTPIASFPVNNLTPGNYILTVTSGGCIDTVQINIAAGPVCCSISLSATTVQPTCGQSDGSITITATPASTYNYSWSNSLPNQATQSNLAAGQYSVTVISSTNPTCTADTTINLNTSNGPTLTFSNQVNPTCAGSNGSITVTLAGGQAPYTVTIDTGGTPQSFQLPFAISQTLTNLPAGTVNVTVVDANNCQATASATLVAPANCCTFTVSDVIVQPNCGATDGSIALTATNGSGNYSFAWAGGPATSSYNNIGAGTYNVTITDNAYANCTLDTTYTLSNPNAPVINGVTVVDETCPGSADGTATINASGGTGTLSYAWSNTQTGATATGLTAGALNFTVTDANNCQATGTTTIGSGFCCTLQASATVTNGSCGLNNAVITVNIDSSGTAPYSYSLNGGPSQPSNVFNSLASGSYTVVTTDNSGCEDTVTVTVQPSSNSLTLTITTTPVTCNGSTDATATVTPNGGAAPINYVWSTNQTTSTITGLPADIYSVTATDASGCSGSASVSITEPAPLTLNIGNDISGCEGTPVTIDAGSGYASYSWSNNATTQTISPTTSGTYSVTVSDTSGCTASDAVVVTFTPIPDIDLGDDKTVYYGDNVGLFANINPIPTGGNYNWLPDTLLSCNNCQNTVALAQDTITYVLFFTDDDGCSSSDTITLYVLPPGNIFWPNAFTPNGDGNNDIYLPGGNNIKLIVWRIFNRWGEKVFESNSQFVGWDGRYKNAPQPPNVYVYYAEVTFMNNVVEKYKGSITLIR